MNQTLLKRRTFLARSGLGLGSLAAGAILGRSAQAATGGGRADLPHFPATAKRVIYLFQSGGPSHIDLFDHSPALGNLHGKPLPDSVRGGQRLTGMTAGQKQFLVSGPVSPMRQRGQSGTWMSDLVPHTAGIADKITVVNSMHTEAINHDPGITLINTGSQIPGRPSLGSWASYGLGSSNANMPSYVVLLSQGNGKNPGQPIFSRLWGSGFLPSQHQGVLMRSSGAPLLYLDDPPGLDRETRREMLDDLAALNRGSYEKFADPEIETRIAQYEMAFRMQIAAPEIVDLSDEPESTFGLYGEEAREPGTYAYNCLLARRLAERDVRFNPAIPSRLGSAREPGSAFEGAVQGHRSSVGGTRQRPRTAWSARRHAGDLGRRIRAHELQPGRAWQRPRSPRPLLLHLDGRRGDQTRARPRSHR